MDDGPHSLNNLVAMVTTLESLQEIHARRLDLYLPRHVSSSGFFAIQDTLLLPRHDGAGSRESISCCPICWNLPCGQLGWLLAFIFQAIATAQCAFLPISVFLPTESTSRPSCRRVPLVCHPPPRCAQRRRHSRHHNRLHPNRGYPARHVQLNRDRVRSAGRGPRHLLAGTGAASDGRRLPRSRRSRHSMGTLLHLHARFSLAPCPGSHGPCVARQAPPSCPLVGGPGSRIHDHGRPQ